MFRLLVVSLLTNTCPTQTMEGQSSGRDAHRYPKPFKRYCLVVSHLLTSTCPAQTVDGKVVREGYSPACVRSVLDWLSPKYYSAFPLGQEVRDKGWFSTWKFRGDTETKHMIDYIFSTDGLEATSRLLPPKPSSMEKHGIPALAWPSDHFSFASRFRWIGSDVEGNTKK